MLVKDFDKLYKDKAFNKRLVSLANRYYSRFKTLFDNHSWDMEDIAQELWFRISEKPAVENFGFTVVINEMRDILRSLKSDCRNIDFEDIENFAIDSEDGEESQDEILGRLVYHKKARYLTV